MRRNPTVTVEVDVEVDLSKFTNGEILEIVREPGIDLPHSPKARPSQIAAATEDVDDWINELRMAFLARDNQHFEVLLCRYEGRFRHGLIAALAEEMV